MQTIKQYFRGAFELALLMRGGINSFPNDFRVALQSFWVLALSLPAGILWHNTHRPEGLELVPFSELLALLTLAGIAGMAVFLVCLWFFARLTGRLDGFWRFIAASNWVGVYSTLTLLALTALATFDVADFYAIRRMAVIQDAYFYVVSGFIIHYALRIPASLAAALAIFSLFLAQTGWDMIYYHYGVPLPW